MAKPKKTKIKTEGTPKVKLSKAEQLKPFKELVTISCRQVWEKRFFIEFVQDTYKGCDIKVEELNPRQIALTIDGERIPEEGYLSMK
jgi:hypothetical protein